MSTGPIFLISGEARDLIYRTKSARFSVFKDSNLRKLYMVGLFRRFSPSQTKSVLKSFRVWAPITVFATRKFHSAHVFNGVGTLDQLK
jgi:hypothetical protein